MLVLKGAFVSILLFVVVTALYVTIPRTAAQAQGIRHMGPAQFPVDFLHKAGMLTLRFGVVYSVWGSSFPLSVFHRKPSSVNSIQCSELRV